MPAHVGVPGNERADVLAGDAATRLAPNSPVPFRDVFSTIRTAVLASWQGRWEALGPTTKMGEVTGTVVRPWSYALVN